MGDRNFLDWQYIFTMARGKYSSIRGLFGYFSNEVVKVIVKYILFMLALANLIAIVVLTYKNKRKWVMSMSIVEIVLVYLALTIDI